MNFPKIKTFLAATAIALLSGTTVLHAQTNRPTNPTLDDVCRANIYAPIVGSWLLKLDVSVYPNQTDGLVSLNIGGILSETDDLDLPQHVSPAFGAWQAQDCHHYSALFRKLVYHADTQAFERTTLKGPAHLSDDGQSLSGQLDQQFFDADGQLLRSDVVQFTGTRITIDDTTN